MSQTTQCPSCQTKFKVSDAHLALAGGMVRCGRCSHVFHAPSHLEAAVPEVPQAPPVPPAPPVMSQPASAADMPLPGSLDDDFELELPDFQPAPARPAPAPTSRTPVQALPDTPIDDADFDLPDFDLLDKQRVAAAPIKPEPPAPIAAPATDIAPDFRAAAAEAEASRQEIAAFQQALAEALRSPTSNKKLSAYQSEPEPEPAEPDEPPAPSPAPAMATRTEPVFRAPAAAALPEQDEPAPEEPPAANAGALKTTLQSLVAILLGLALLGQIAFFNRTRISAEAPELRPAFEALCASLGCSVPLPTDRQLIRTEWSELSFVPQNDHLIQLNATLKNLANYPQAFPVMELTLKDAEDKVVARKAFRPEDYVPANELKLGQFNGNSELKLQLRMEMTQGKALGYSLHFYYP
ncbi:DUF3426 domain-containing protein [Vogesella mureinivorans]|uniref:DUF3426 domain-containing protein n=1 Tax=Vogesella mureinivorans TaxID=657276 RepID=UPI0011C85243|nr:DUF3426 domain-containing protein [Vogesella mureinivorans]